MQLQDKVAVVYGAAGAIGGAVASAFAAEGAQVFLTGRTSTSPDVAAVDARDEGSVDEHLRSVIERAGRVDISFNAIGIPDAQVVGVPLTDVGVEQFALPIREYTTSYFLTARLAARHMVPRGSGVIMTVSALPARMGSRLNGGYGPAQAAKEALTRDLSAELAPHGIRVVALRPHAIPETSTMREVFDLKVNGALSWEGFEGALAGTTHPGRVIRLEEVADAAVFAASDKASGLTGTSINLTMGSLDD
jgi:NAD(P)-dependent dehydrogenase (short-subunit alcohol dehydrogenase family)